MQRRLNRLKPKAEVLHGEANSIWTTCNRSDDYVANHPYKPKLRRAYGAGRIQNTIWGRYSDYLVVPCVGVDRGLLVGVETITPDGRKRFLGKKTGCLILGNDLQRSTAWWAFEGWATAAYCLQERFVETAIVAFGKSRQELQTMVEDVAHVFIECGSTLNVGNSRYLCSEGLEVDRGSWGTTGVRAAGRAGV